jgi:hypothetical protein
MIMSQSLIELDKYKYCFYPYDRTWSLKLEGLPSDPETLKPFAMLQSAIQEGAD